MSTSRRLKFLGFRAPCAVPESPPCQWDHDGDTAALEDPKSVSLILSLTSKRSKALLCATSFPSHGVIQTISTESALKRRFPYKNQPCSFRISHEIKWKKLSNCWGTPNGTQIQLARHRPMPQTPKGCLKQSLSLKPSRLSVVPISIILNHQISTKKKDWGN